MSILIGVSSMPLYSWFSKKRHKNTNDHASHSPTFTTDEQTWPIAKVNKYHEAKALTAIKPYVESKSRALITIDDTKPSRLSPNNSSG